MTNEPLRETEMKSDGAHGAFAAGHANRIRAERRRMIERANGRDHHVSNPIPAVGAFKVIPPRSGVPCAMPKIPRLITRDKIAQRFQRKPSAVPARNIPEGHHRASTP